MKNKRFEDLINEGYEKYTENINNINEKSKIRFSIEGPIMSNVIYTLKVHDSEKKLFSGECSFIGSFDKTSHVFQWGWNDLITNKQKMKDSLRIKKYGKILEGELIKNEYIDVEIIETTIFCITNPIFIASEKLLQWIKKIYVYVLEGLYPIIYEKNDIEYYLMAKNITSY